MHMTIGKPIVDIVWITALKSINNTSCYNNIITERAGCQACPICIKKEGKDFKEPSEFVLCDYSESEDSQKNLEIVPNSEKKDIIATFCHKITGESSNIFSPIIKVPKIKTNTILVYWTIAFLLKSIIFNPI